MFTGTPRYHFNLQPVPPGRGFVRVGNVDFLRVLSVGSLYLAFYTNTHSGESDYNLQLSEVLVLEGLSSHLFSLHHAQRKQQMLSNKNVVYLLNGRRVFRLGVNGSSL